ncbi:MAG: glucuronate isomerase [Phycisphaerae bacterium]|nr:glucuronate isomerase [Phycisphaerae bacterium]
MTLENVESVVQHALLHQPITDMHTHLYPPTFGTPVPNRAGHVDADGLMLWGIDQTLTYHYLVAEVFRVVPATQLPFDTFWKMTVAQQADHIWQTLFIERTPISEACRGVLTVLERLGLDPNEKSLDTYRRFFNQQDPDDYLNRVMELAGVNSITMTNPVFDDNERQRWLGGANHPVDSRFKAVLRIDAILRDYPMAARRLHEWGYGVQPQPDARGIAEVQRFLREWLDRQQAIYMAVSLPPEWTYPISPAAAGSAATAANAGQTMLEQAVLPVCRERKLPLGLMIGARLRVQAQLREAGDMVGRADVLAVVNLCLRHPDNKFLVTMLSRENQHELCVAARKFGNLMIFGCWWFLNNPSLIEEITRMRLELLGTSFIPQHSDARVLDQLLYKWPHSRECIGRALADKYRDLLGTGLRLTQAQVQRDARLLLVENFQDFLSR